MPADLRRRDAEVATMLLNAASALTAPANDAVDLVPAGMPIRDGRVSLRRHLPVLARLEPGDQLAVVVGFGTGCWVGLPGRPAPDLGRLAYRGSVCPDYRGRVVLDRSMRAYLHVSNPKCFDAVLVPLRDAVLVIPAEGFSNRCRGIVL